MSTIPLSSIQELIERSIFESIREELVDKGYLPDINLYPNTPAGRISYDAAVKAIADGPLGFAIEVYSESSNQSKGVKKVPRIVVKTGSFVPGALGGDPSKVLVRGPNGFTPTVTPPQTSEFYIDFHLTSSTVKQERILNALLAISVPRRGYIPFYTDHQYSFFVKYVNFYNHDDVEQGIIEKVYAYEVQDCWETEDLVIGPMVAKMHDITMDINLQKYLDGSFGYDADTLHVFDGHILGTSNGVSTVEGNLQ